MEVLGVIIARGGSKGIPGKNLRLLGGKSLINYSIEAAQNAGRLTEFVVSTDSEEIATQARAHGAPVPFLRPPELSNDVISPIHAVLHAKHYFENLDRKFDAILMLQPTAPFRTAADIEGAIELMEKTNSDSVISVVNVGANHPARMKYLDGDRLVDPPFCEAYENQRRQELTPMYIRNGAIYLTRSAILEKESFKGSDCRAWIMPEERSVNLDSERDFRFAEWLIETGQI